MEREGFTAKNTCKTDPQPDQAWKVKKPNFYTSVPGCEFVGSETVFAEVCNWCKGTHQPCAGEFTICTGCHENEVSGHKFTSSISCNSLLAFILAENTCVVSLGEKTSEELPNETDLKDIVQHNQGQAQAELDKAVKDKVGVELSNECADNTTHMEWQLIPARFEYSCEDCGKKGSTGLLTRCCDICMEFQAALEATGTFKPFTICRGCDVTEVHVPLLENAVPFARDKYKSFTEEAAMQQMKEWLQLEPVSLDQATCEQESSKNSRRLETQIEVSNTDPDRACKDHRDAANKLGADLPDLSLAWRSLHLMNSLWLVFLAKFVLF